MIRSRIQFPIPVPYEGFLDKCISLFTKGKSYESINVIKKASKVRDDEEVRTLLDIIEDAFSKTRALGNFGFDNPDSCFGVDSIIDINFEINNLLSDEYAICAKVNLIHGDEAGYELQVRVSTVRFIDKRGMGSQNYEYDEESEDEYIADGNHSIAKFADQIKNLMIRQHTSLIQSVGVSSYKLAYDTAKKCF